MAITIHPNGLVTGGTIKSPGNIIQVANTAELSTFICDSTSYEDITDATITITPSSSSSKLLIIWTCYVVNTLKSGYNAKAHYQTLRGSTNVYESSHAAESGSGGLQIKGTCNHTFVDSPATASAVTYKVQTKISHSDADTYTYEGRLMAFEIAV